MCFGVCGRGRRGGEEDSRYVVCVGRFVREVNLLLITPLMMINL